MSLNGYNEVSSSTTKAGAPIGAGQVDAFRQNDALFERLLRAIMVSPLVPIAKEDVVTNPDAEKLVLARKIRATSTIHLKAQTPLVWLATESIEIKATINGAHKGALAGQAGDFGGSGGGGATNAGGHCLTPVAGHQMVTGGASPGTNGTQISKDWASRVMAVLTLCRGGAGGGKATTAVGGAEDGGNGGGVVILCAPEIIIDGGSIDVQGQAGQGTDSGGGGGGLILLSAHNITGLSDPIAHPGDPAHPLPGTVLYKGGGGNGAGGDGGNGRALIRKIQ